MHNFLLHIFSWLLYESLNLSFFNICTNYASLSVISSNPSNKKGSWILKLMMNMIVGIQGAIVGGERYLEQITTLVLNHGNVS